MLPNISHIMVPLESSPIGTLEEMENGVSEPEADVTQATPGCRTGGICT